MGIVFDAVMTQGALQTGTEGWWRVFGASAHDVQKDDMVVSQTQEFRVAHVVRHGDLRDVVSPGFVGTDGETYHIGAMCPIVVLRKGTRHILAPSI